MESFGLAGALLMIYEGSIYFTLVSIPSFLKKSRMESFKKIPISLNFTFPEASFSPVCETKSCPAPSATESPHVLFPISVSSGSPADLSGHASQRIFRDRQKFTSLCASAVLAAINPDSRPITLTRPMPLIDALASVCAPRTDGTAWSRRCRTQRRSG